MTRDKMIRKRRRGGIAAAVAAALLAILLPARASYALDLDGGECTVTVTSPDTSDEAYADFNKAGVTLDVYQIAAAVEMTGYDAYVFEMPDPFSSAPSAAAWQEALNAEEWTAADADAFSQQLAAFVLADVPEYLSEEQAGQGVERYTTGNMDQPITLKKEEGNGGGLYLIIPHGENEDYKKTAEDGTIATIANSEAKQYVFAPILISVPVRGDAQIGLTGDIRNTAGDGDWQYALTIGIKVGVEDLSGKLRITKQLDSYETVGERTDPATFVFSVEATLGGRSVYSDVISMVFSAPGEQTVEIENIPVGALATVREIYAGGNYRLAAGSDTVEVTVLPSSDEEDEEVATASFVNTYDTTWHGGGSVRNHFEADGDTWSPTGSTKTYADDDERGEEPLVPSSGN